MGIKSHYKPVHGYCVNLNLPWWELQPRAAHAHCQQHDTYGAGQLANSICARTSTATHWYLSQEYIPRVCLPSHLHDTASSVQDAGTELSIDQLLSLIRSEVELNSTRWPLLSTTSQGNNTILWVACGCMYVFKWYNGSGGNTWLQLRSPWLDPTVPTCRCHFP